MGAGLGGGSSDAASFLNILNSRFSLNYTSNALKIWRLIWEVIVPFLLKTSRCMPRAEEMSFRQFKSILVRTTFLQFIRAFTVTQKKHTMA